jgi:hypothetical protein
MGILPRKFRQGDYYEAGFSFVSKLIIHMSSAAIEKTRRVADSGIGVTSKPLDASKFEGSVNDSCPFTCISGDVQRRLSSESCEGPPPL